MKVFGLVIGLIFVIIYKEIVNSDLDFSDCIFVNLDEYVGIVLDND